MYKRNIFGIELLRIVAMLMILVLHYLLHGGILYNLDKNLNLYNVTIIVLETFCIVAVNVYVLISGYLLSDKEWNFNRVINIIKKVWFYSIICGCILLLFGKIELNFKNILYIFFPILTQRYWFVNSYIFLVFLTPFINKFMSVLSKEQFKILLILLTIFNSIIPLFTKNAVTMLSANSLPWFINLYLISAFIKKYDIYFASKKCNLGYIFSNAILMVLAILFFYFFDISKVMFLFKYNSIFVLIPAIMLFLMFIRLKDKDFKNKNMLLFFSKASFSVYLITENHFVRNLLWDHWVDTFKLYGSILQIFYIILVAIMIYIFCSIIDYVVSMLIKMTDFKLFSTKKYDIIMKG